MSARTLAMIGQNPFDPCQSRQQALEAARFMTAHHPCWATEHRSSSPIDRRLACQIALQKYQHPEFTVAPDHIHKAAGADILTLQEADMRFGNRAGQIDSDALRRDLGLIAFATESVRVAHGLHGNLLPSKRALVEVVHHLHLPGFRALQRRGPLLQITRMAGKDARCFPSKQAVAIDGYDRKREALRDLSAIRRLSG